MKKYWHKCAICSENVWGFQNGTWIFYICTNTRNVFGVHIGPWISSFINHSLFAHHCVHWRLSARGSSEHQSLTMERNSNGVGHQRLSQSSAGGRKTKFVPVSVKPRPSHGWPWFWTRDSLPSVIVCGLWSDPSTIIILHTHEGGETTEYRKPGECRVLCTYHWTCVLWDSTGLTCDKLCSKPVGILTSSSRWHGR